MIHPKQLLLFVLLGTITASALGNAEPTETQIAQCTITSGDVKASAQASLTTKLDGICESQSLFTAFAYLESKLMQEIYNIRLVLSQIQNPHYNLQQHNQFLHPPVNMAATIYQNIQKIVDQAKEQNSGEVSSSENTVQTTLPDSSLNEIPEITTKPILFQTTTTPTTSGKPLLLKSLPSKFSSIRESEVHKYNNTILSGQETQIFTYYWKIDHYKEKLKKNITQVESPGFVISAQSLRVKAELNHLKRDYLYLQLEQSPKEVSGNGSIILETGSIFKEIETKKFFRHKIAILDHTSAKNDLISQEFLNINTGFPIPNSAILSSSYCRNDVILIKVLIYL
ncbi:mediator of RNA polymerase II transcription subunit 15 [Sergentomyia squamirostris]